MNHKPLYHQSYLMVFGALSTLVVIILFANDWHDQQLRQRQAANARMNQAITLSPEQISELWRPIRAGSSTNTLTATETAMMLRPMRGGQVLTEEQVRTMFTPVRTNTN